MLFFKMYNNIIYFGQSTEGRPRKMIMMMMTKKSVGGFVNCAWLLLYLSGYEEAACLIPEKDNETKAHFL